MSEYSFIASDFQLPEIDNTSAKVITVAEAIKLGIKPHELIPWEKMDPHDKVLCFDKESDLDELVIREDSEFMDNVRWYTGKRFIYSVTFRYSDSRGKQLLEYLKENIRAGHCLELWSIWLDTKESIKPITYKHNEINLDAIKKVYDWNGSGYSNYSCIVIK